MDTEQSLPKAGHFTPILHVADIGNSISFYQLLGFQTIDTDQADPLGWARMHCEGGAVMFLRAEEQIDASRAPVLFYMYSPDLLSLRDLLLANAIDVPPIKFPEYMPSGEFYISDPDGYRIGVAHWGQKEHDSWLERIASRR